MVYVKVLFRNSSNDTDFVTFQHDKPKLYGFSMKMLHQNSHLTRLNCRCRISNGGIAQFVAKKRFLLPSIIC